MNYLPLARILNEAYTYDEIKDVIMRRFRKTTYFVNGKEIIGDQAKFIAIGCEDPTENILHLFIVCGDNLRARDLVANNHTLALGKYTMDDLRDIGYDGEVDETEINKFLLPLTKTKLSTGFEITKVIPKGLPNQMKGVYERTSDEYALDFHKVVIGNRILNLPNAWDDKDAFKVFGLWAHNEKRAGVGRMKDFGNMGRVSDVTYVDLEEVSEIIGFPYDDYSGDELMDAFNDYIADNIAVEINQKYIVDLDKLWPKKLVDYIFPKIKEHEFFKD